MIRRVAASVAAISALTCAAPAGAAPARVSVAVDRTTISTAIGKKFTLHSRITNHGSAAASGLIAHLNVLSLRDGVYIDPEDWSSHRTRYLPPIPGGGSLTITWKLQAVNSGSIGVYVAVLPQSAVSRPPTTGPTVRVLIAHRQTLNSGGILPLALAIPGALGLLTIGLRARRRHA